MSNHFRYNKTQTESANTYHKNGQRRYPFSIVYTPIPILSWLIPHCGHVGVGDSCGIIYDFVGSKTINVDDMAFGSPTLYYKLESNGDFAEKWDSSIKKSMDKFKTKNHYIIFSNCYSFVSDILRNSGFGFWTYNPVCFVMRMFSGRRYVGFKGYLKTWAPVILIGLTIVVTIMALKIKK
ncbi:hypothetical protein ACOME3_006050 [Neoechinorhynchus agilis]